jgi:hypothetical protein
MKRLIRWMKRLIQRMLGIGVLNLQRKAEQAKLAAQRAENFAQQRQFVQALVTGQEVLAQWDSAASWVERLIYRWTMQRSRLLFKEQVLGWQYLILLDYEAGARQAETLAQQRQFVQALVKGQEVLSQWDSAASWIEQQMLQLQKQMWTWQSLAQRDYQAALERSHWLATEGRFQDAIDLLEPLHNQLFHSSGELLLDRMHQIIDTLSRQLSQQSETPFLENLRQTLSTRKTLHQLIDARKWFYLGLQAEKAEHWLVAKQYYQTAMSLSSHWKTECQLRLGLVAMKTAKWSEGLSYLKDVQTQQAIDLREICYAQQTNGQSRIPRQQPFEQPRLEVEVWRRQDWQEIARVAEECWLTHRNSLTLHNWAIATYYRSLNTGQHWNECIIALSTAFANLRQDPALETVPWLPRQSVDHNEIDHSEINAQLKQHLEELVKGLESTDPTQWSQICPLYRLETTALDLMGNPPTEGLEVEGLFITPGCYQHYRPQFKCHLFRTDLIWTLYTDWWQAIIACRDGNIFQAIQLRPQREPTFRAEQFAQAFVCYYEGCYYLQIQPDGYLRWRLAMAPLRQAKSVIQSTPKWLVELDLLCEADSNAIWHTSDRNEFVHFWYEIARTQLAAHYLNQLDR